MTAPTAATTETVVSVLHDLINKPLGEQLILLTVSAVLIFLLVASLSFVVSKMKGNVKVSLFSFLKIGKSKASKEKEKAPAVAEDKKDINITINNQATSTSTDDVRKENEFLNQIINQPEPVEVPCPPEQEYQTTNTDLIIIISKSVRFGSEMEKHRDIYLIKSQMSAAEVRIDIIEGLLSKEYMELVYKRKGPATNIQEDQSYRIFSEIIHHQTHRNTLAVLRRLFKENHLVQYTDEKYAEYMDTQCERMMMGIRLSINSSMPTFLDPGREAVNSIIEKCAREIIETFQDIFIEARALAYKTETIIKKKEREFDEEIKRLTGIHNAHARADFKSEDPYGCGEPMEER